MTKILDLFGYYTGSDKEINWQDVVGGQYCPFTNRRCFKVRKSEPEVSIGTCTVSYQNEPIVICPIRLLERRQIFLDCFHLLTGHQPGNEIHIIPEVKIPGGNIDYFLASVKNGKVRDFIGIELQTLDTTGTVWPERQRFLASVGFEIPSKELNNNRPFGMNWKMTAKTTLVQLHHKIQTFEAVNKHLVLVVQDRLLDYMTKEFSFSHLSEPAVISDSMHFHAYRLLRNAAGLKLELAKRLSTDTAGIASCLGLQTNPKLELEVIIALIEQKITPATHFDFGKSIPPIDVKPEA